MFAIIVAAIGGISVLLIVLGLGIELETSVTLEVADGPSAPAERA